MRQIGSRKDREDVSTGNVLADTFDDICECARGYTTDPNSRQMIRRKALLKEAVGFLRHEVPTLVHATGLALVPVGVESGGDQGLMAPVPWIRVFSPEFSPRTTEGFYIVYLFSADGSCLYLSLNQGTSEFRSGRMRPILDPDVLTRSASAGRIALQELDAPVLSGGVPSIDLRVDELAVKHESKIRAHNYEHANIVAIRYRRREIPEDQQLLGDLRSFAPLLAELYIPGPYERPTINAKGPRAARGQGRRLTKQERLAVEARSMDMAIKHFERRGWAVENTSRFRPYDLECKKPGVELHVEVKGTTTRGEEILLTPNEVNHAEAFPLMSLYVLSDIALEVDASNEIRATGGTVRIYEPWRVDSARLTPSGYIYSLDR